MFRLSSSSRLSHKTSSFAGPWPGLNRTGSHSSTQPALHFQWFEIQTNLTQHQDEALLLSSQSFLELTHQAPEACLHPRYRHITNKMHYMCKKYLYWEESPGVIVNRSTFLFDASKAIFLAKTLLALSALSFPAMLEFILKTSFVYTSSRDESVFEHKRSVLYMPQTRGAYAAKNMPLHSRKY